MPENYNAERIEVRSFEYIYLKDGTEVTTYYDDANKTHLYMDWETQEWKPVPQEWLEGASSQELIDDPRTGEYHHPEHGSFVTYLFENERNTRLYFNEPTGTWERMPLEWEVELDDVAALLQDLDEAFPAWKNVNEQLLVLRECNYNVSEAMQFASINFSQQFAENEQKTAKDQAAVAKMSLADMKRMKELERLVAEKQERIDHLMEEQSEKSDSAQKQLVREKTKVEAATLRQERAHQEAEERIEQLMETNGELRSKVSDLEAKLVGMQADNDKLKQLETQVATLSDTSDKDQAIKELNSKFEQMRMENVALKLKIQSLKQRLTKTDNIGDKYRDMQTRVRNLKREKQEAMDELKAAINELNPMFEQALQHSKQLKDNTTAQLEDITKKYLHEQTQRKLLYNKVQELRGNIRVFCRVRFDDRGPCMFQFPSDTEAIVQKLQGGTEMYEFEHVYGPNSKQEKVFSDTKPIILSCVDGYNVCIMAYGQTGSGKTYTMMGPPDNPGVNRRAIRELLDLCNGREEVEYEIKVSLMEVYNEKIFDLLTADRSKDLKIHASPKGTYVGGLIEQVVKTQEDVFEVMATGDKHRSVGATQMNTDSSRSHLLLQLTVTGYNTISKASTTGKLTLVDLAGSERVSKTDASGERLVEAAAINKSLTCLGQVFKALASSSPHIPYRNSKLTHALQDSLGGDSKTAIFVNMSPLESNLSETHMTLKFGQNIRKIELGPATKKKGPPRPKK
jgi:kinesin family protein C2/C3